MNALNTLLAAVAIAAPLLSGCDNCGELRSEAKALMEEYGACSEGDTCVVVDMYDLVGPENCLGPFQCGQAVNAKTRLGDLQERAVVIAEDYDTCSQCEQAGCANPATLQARCNATTRQCETYSTDSIADAGAAD